MHECYPGHYVQFKLRETWYREGTAAADGLLSMVNSASSSTFEGIADNGLHVIDWIETDDDRFSALLGRYRSGIGDRRRLAAARADWTRHAVLDWLRERALVGGEGWAANRMRFIRRRSAAALIWSYWWGGLSVHPVGSDNRPNGGRRIPALSLWPNAFSADGGNVRLVTCRFRHPSFVLDMTTETRRMNEVHVVDPSGDHAHAVRPGSVVASLSGGAAGGFRRLSGDQSDAWCYYPGCRCSHRKWRLPSGYRTARR